MAAWYLYAADNGNTGCAEHILFLHKRFSAAGQICPVYAATIYGVRNTWTENIERKNNTKTKSAKKCSGLFLCGYDTDYSICVCWDIPACIYMIKRSKHD